MIIKRKNKIELTFMGFGILMVITVVLLVIQAFSFLLGNISTALDKKADEAKAPVSFQIDRAEAIIKK